MARNPQNYDSMRTVSQMMSLEGRVALVSGAAGGIGSATSYALAQLGATVALVDIPVKKAQLDALAADLTARCNTVCRGYTVDISDEQSVKDLFETVTKDLGIVTVMHNNAGIGIWPDDSNLPTASWQKMLDVNLSGSFYMARTCALKMREAGQKGSIVTTASMSGHIINAGPGYSATKAGVKHMSASLAIEFAETGIRFNTVSYGYILSGMHKCPTEEALDALLHGFEVNTPMKRMGELDEVVGAVVFAATELSSFMTGSDILVDGGFSIGRLF